jgi:hypothetical protein
LGRASGQSLTRLWCRCQPRRRLQMLWTSLDVLEGMFHDWSLIFQVKTFLAHRRGGDDGFDIVSFLEGSPWKSYWSASHVKVQLGEWLKIWTIDREENWSLAFFFFSLS